MVHTGAPVGEAVKVLIAGDTHANYRHLDYLITEAQRHGVHLIVQVGDFGFLFRDNGLPAVEQRLAAAGLDLWWLDGNHENFDMLAALGASPDDDAPTVLTAHVTYLPRGYRFTLDGCRFMAFGGAVSVDQAHRTAGVSWWPQETITDAQVSRAIDGPPVDVLLAHDAPGEVPVLVDMLARIPILGGSGDGLKMDRASLGNRTRLGQVYDALTPRLVVHGHYHHFYLTDHTHGRVVGLDRDGRGRESYLILDTERLMAGAVA